MNIFMIIINAHLCRMLVFLGVFCRILLCLGICSSPHFGFQVCLEPDLERPALKCEWPHNHSQENIPLFHRRSNSSLYKGEHSTQNHSDSKTYKQENESYGFYLFCYQCQNFTRYNFTTVLSRKRYQAYETRCRRRFQKELVEKYFEFNW